MSIDNLKALRQLKSVEAVQKLERVSMRYGGAAETRVCYISSTIFRFGANGVLAYGVLDAYGYVPHAVPLFANLVFSGTGYMFGWILHGMGNECVDEAKKAVKLVIEGQGHS